MNKELNLEEIRDGVYICRTQSGFKKLMRQTFVNSYDNWKDISHKVETYPKRYPAIVIPDSILFFEAGQIRNYIVYPEDF